MEITLKLRRTDEAPEEVHLSDTDHIILRDQDIEWIDLSPLKKCKDLRELELHKNELETIDLAPLRVSDSVVHPDAMWHRLQLVIQAHG